MRCLFGLAEMGVRVIFVPVLIEGWLYVTQSKLLLMAENLSADDRAEAARRVRAALKV